MTDAPRSRRRVLIGGLVAAAVAAAALYGSLSGRGNSAAGDCRAATVLAQRLDPLARGEVAAVKVERAPKPVPDLSFDRPDGQRVRLADFRGKTVLLNLWATWCAPCRQEMPALDKLQAELGGTDFEVVAVNIDTRNLDKPKRWLEETGVTRLAYYADPQAKIFQDLRQVGKAVGMPTTILIDPQGCEMAHLSGPAEWASEDAVRLVRAALGR